MNEMLLCQTDLGNVVLEKSSLIAVIRRVENESYIESST